MSVVERGVRSPKGRTGSARTRRRRVLFVSENVSLAQVVRLRQLAATLPTAHYEVSFAASHFDPMIFAGTDFTQVPIKSMSARTMLRRQQLGARLFGTGLLNRYVKQELSLLDSLQPDLVVGDLRLSLAVSAPVLGIPYAALINAYWSPYGVRDGFPIPEHPAIGLLGLERVAPHFEKARPWVFDHFAAPVNTLRRRHGLSPIGSLMEVLTHGDHTLYPDVPALTPTRDLPGHHHFLGPVLWAPGGSLPEAVAAPDPRPLIYVTMGSTGGLRVLREVLRALGSMPVRVLLATAGRFPPGSLPDNVLAVPFAPGDLAARAADLVICNGGSSTGYQALHEGTPVLGLPANFDQYLAMSAIERAGAGVLLRSGTARASEIEAAVEALLRSDLHRAAATRLATALQGLDHRRVFPALLDRITGQAGSAPD